MIKGERDDVHRLWATITHAGSGFVVSYVPGNLDGPEDPTMTDGATVADVLQVCRQCHATLGLAVRHPAVRRRLLAGASAEERRRLAEALRQLSDTAAALHAVLEPPATELRDLLDREAFRPWRRR